MADSLTIDPTMDGHRFFRITERDHRGVILTISIICEALILVSLTFHGTIIHNDIGTNDGIAVLASVVALVQNVVVWIAVSRGLGKSYIDIASTDAKAMGKLLLASVVLSLVIEFVAKSCVILLCRRIFGINMKRHRLCCDTMIVVCGLWCLGSILTLIINCDSLQQVGYHASFCPSFTLRWNLVAIVDGVTEVLIFSLSLAVVLPLHMRTGRKIPIILTFAVRLIAIGPIGLHAHYITVTTHSSNPGVEIINPTVCRQVLILFTIISAAMPTLNRGLRKFNTSMGSTWMETTLSNTEGGKGTTNRGSIPLDPLRKSKSQKRSEFGAKRRLIDEGKTVASFRPDEVGHITRAYAVDPDARSGQSQGSQDSETEIIRRDMEWAVYYEDRGIVKA